jgi:hypothetical protein
MNEKFSRRTFTPSVDMLRMKDAGIFAASVPAPATSPRSSNVRARPSTAMFSVAASFAAVADTIAESKRIFASANNCAGVSSGPMLIALCIFLAEEDDATRCCGRLRYQLCRLPRGFGVCPPAKLRGDRVARPRAVESDV